MNLEITEVFDDKDIIMFIKSQRLRWMGHIIRMDNTRGVSRIFNAKPMLTRPRGRPRCRRKEEVEKNVRKIRITNWRKVAKNREECKKIVTEAYIHLG